MDSAMSADTPTNEELLEAARQGDEGALAALVERHRERLEVGQKLVDLHRFHLGAQLRDAGQEVSLHRGPLPQVTSLSLAEHLLGKLSTASQAAMRAELKLRVQEALNTMDPHDREVLILRHFEELSNAEAAQVLGIKPSAAVNRYVRALKRLKDEFQGMPGGIEGIWG